jgi:hypothetical protein
MSAGLAWGDPLRVEGSERGLGVTGPDTPQVLQQIAGSPYAPSEGASCQELAEQIAALNDVLGPDLDTPAAQARKSSFGRTAGGVVRSFIPYRGLMRLVTGASRKEQRLGQAVVAGAARRGYLRGLAHERGCDATVSAVTAAPAPAEASAKVAASSVPAGGRIQAAAADVALITPPPYAAN